MIKLKPRERNLAIIVAVFVIISGLYFLAYLPISEKLEDLDNQINEKELALRRGLELSKIENEINSQYKDMQGILVVNSTEEELVANFLKEIGSLVRNTAVSLIDLKPQSKYIKTSDYKKYLVDISVEGTLEQIINFLYVLETSQYLLRVERCSLSSKTENSNILKSDMLVSGVIIPQK